MLYLFRVIHYLLSHLVFYKYMLNGSVSVCILPTKEWLAKTNAPISATELAWVLQNQCQTR